MPLTASARNWRWKKWGARRRATAQTSAASESCQGQGTSQHEVGVSPVRVDFNRLTQALDPARHSPEIDIGKADEKVPLEEERIARAEPHGFLNMGTGFVPPPEEELHSPM